MPALDRSAFGHRSRVRPALATLLLVASPARAQPAPIQVAASQRLGFAVYADAGSGWCADRPVFRVEAGTKKTFSSADFLSVMQRVGTALVAQECRQAQAIDLTGTVRGSPGTAWRASASAGDGWAVRALPAAGPEGLDLDALPAQPSADMPAAPANQGKAATAEPEAAPAPGPPERLADAGIRRAEAALGALPGRFDARRRCWVATVREQGSVTTGCLRIVLAYQVPAPGGAQVHVMLTGNGNQDCHTCSGLGAFAVLDAAGPDWSVLARPVVARSGEFGKPDAPSAATFARLGAQRWGWIVKRTGFGQGFTEGLHAVYIARGPAVVEAGTLPGDAGNGGACTTYGPGMPACEMPVDLTVTAAVDGSNPAAAAYPILLRARGIQGRQVDKRAVARFDEAGFRYAGPGNWP